MLHILRALERTALREISNYSGLNNKCWDKRTAEEEEDWYLAHELTRKMKSHCCAALRNGLAVIEEKDLLIPD